MSSRSHRSHLTSSQIRPGTTAMCLCDHTEAVHVIIPTLPPRGGCAETGCTAFQSVCSHHYQPIQSANCIRPPFLLLMRAGHLVSGLAVANTTSAMLFCQKMKDQLLQPCMLSVRLYLSSLTDHTYQDVNGRFSCARGTGLECSFPQQPVFR